MATFFDFVRNQYTRLPVPPAPGNIADATYIVTGANTGLGYECTKHLFNMGAKRIILGVRSLEKGEAALSTLRNDTGRQDVGEVWPLDLLSLDSVEAFAKRMSTLDRLDGLIANAGVVMTQFQIIEGIESSLLVNVVSTLLLGLRALPKLQDSAHKLGTKPHLVFVLSRTALERKVELNLEQLQGDMFDALGKEEDFKPLLQ